MGSERKAPGAEIAVIVAARNEADLIGATLSVLADALPGATVWVADDASTDGTAEVALARGARVLRRGRAHGKGANVSAAATGALDEKPWPEVVLLCDADLAGSAGELGRLVAAVAQGECDLAVGVFAHREGGGFGVALGVARWAIRRRSGYRAGAPLSGQRALRPELLSELLPFASGYGMEVAMTIDAVRAGARVSEYELELRHRASGRSIAGFAHRAVQLRDIIAAYLSRRGG